jgi:anti-sigma-K factor RskA
MICSECAERLSDYIDGLLELGEQAQVENHLEACESCRALRDDLLQIVHFSRRLPLHTPSSAVWSRIQSEIESRGRRIYWARIWQMGPAPAQIAVAAALLIAVASAALIFFRSNSSPPPEQVTPNRPTAVQAKSPAPEIINIEELERRIDNLKAIVEQRKHNWDPQLRAAFDRDMLYVDQSLIECHHALSDNPADDVSKELMLNAYREKMRLLEGFSQF